MLTKGKEKKMDTKFFAVAISSRMPLTFTTTLYEIVTETPEKVVQEVISKYFPDLQGVKPTYDNYSSKSGAFFCEAGGCLLSISVSTNRTHALCGAYIEETGRELAEL